MPNDVPAETNALGLKYFLTDPYIIGLIGWIGLFVTFVGLWIAIDQIRRVKKAAVAATDATNSLTAAIYSRERLLEMTSSIGNIEIAKNYIIQRMFPLANLCVDLALKECTQVHELVERPEQKNFYKVIVKLNDLSSSLMVAEENKQQNDTAVDLALEARDIIRMLNAAASRLRYRYEDNGAKQ